MFNVSEFKKAVKLLGREASTIDGFCKEVSMYMEAEKKIADNRKLQSLNRRTNHLGETYIFGKFGTGTNSVMMTIAYLGKNAQDAPETQIEKDYRAGVPITLSEVERGDYKFSEIPKEVSLSMEAENTEASKKKAGKKGGAKQVMYIPNKIKERLDYLRGEIEAERISYGEILELQSLSDYIDPSDAMLREWAGLPENTEASKKTADYQGWRDYNTWNMALWLDQDQFELPEEITDVHEAADYIKERMTEDNPLSGTFSTYSDILGNALLNIDYREIAENILSSR